jgi:Na+/proline symporter
MTPLLILVCLGVYFGALFVVSWATSRGQSDSLSTFFVANRQAPWYLVAFGMIGTSLSGVTFISVPGAVGTDKMYYLQVALGYALGYLVVAFVLLPLYYKLNLTSIYEYLQKRFGVWSYKTGASFFLLSRSLGSAARLYLVAKVLQVGVFDAWGVPFWVTAALTLALIWLYTHRGGMRTIIFTDVFQTAFMLAAAALTFYELSTLLEAPTLAEVFAQSPLTEVFAFADPNAPNYFWKQFLGGALITIVMTGLDQDMMQKNLSVRTLKGAQTNMLSYGAALVVVNLLFVSLGVLLYAYVAQEQLSPPGGADQLFPYLAFHHFSPVLGITFFIGLIAAAYSSADGSLTALTTSTCIDLLGTGTHTTPQTLRTKKWVHLGWSAAFLGFILLFYATDSPGAGSISIISLVLKLAGYTYGPLLGLFAYGMFSRRTPTDALVPWVCVAAPLLTLLLEKAVPTYTGYVFGVELLAINAGITTVGLWLISGKAPRASLSQAGV